MKKIVITTLLLLSGLFNAQAQQDPQYTQYMYNMSIVNPAYAGSKEGLSLGALYRKQWINLEGAPSTGTFFGHAPVGKNVGLGLSAIVDQIGPVKEQNVYADFSYTLNLGGEHRLALGIKGGLTMQQVGLLSQVSNFVPQVNDIAFSENTSSSFFNVGSGIFYYTNKYYIAASIPNLLKATYMDVQGRKFGSETNHFFVTGGYVFDINDTFKLKPFAMAKTAFNAPISIDASLNALLFNKLEVGATYRLTDSFGAMVNFAITPSMRIGYAYDHIVSDLNVTTPSSHEFILLYDFNFNKKASASARFF